MRAMGMTKAEAEFAYRVFVKSLFDELATNGEIVIPGIVKVETKIRAGRNHPIWGYQNPTKRLKWTTAGLLREASRSHADSIPIPSKPRASKHAAARSSHIREAMNRAREILHSQQTGDTADSQSRRSDNGNTSQADEPTSAS